MRKLVSLLVLLTFAGTGALAGAGLPEAPPVRFIVAFSPEVIGIAGEDLFGARLVEWIDGLSFAVVEVREAAPFLAAAAADPEVRYVERDNPAYAVLSLVPNDPRYNEAGHYGSKIIGAEAAWDRTTGTTTVKVAMIDSGLNKDHEEFAGTGRVLAGWDYYNGDSNPDDTSGCSWHGTHTTGTAGATINNGKGIAGMSQHTILPLKAFQPGFFGCGGSTSALVNSLKAAGDQGSHVSSNSWSSGSSSSSINDAIDYAHGLGVAHVAAAGNSGPCTNCVSFPWKDRASTVIIVASSTSSDTQSSFSSEGPEVDVIAPGSSILSTTSSPAGYGLLSGTSMATPHVAGTAALVKALNPSWGFTEIEDRIKTTAVDIGLNANKQGAGRLNADGATSGGSPPPPPPPPPPPSDAVHVHDIDHWRTGSSSRGNVYIKVWAYNQNEAAVAGVSVSIQTCKAGGGCATGTADTGSDGTVTFRWSRIGSGTYTTTVTNMVKSGYTWDAAAGHAANGNSESETV